MENILKEIIKNNIIIDYINDKDFENKISTLINFILSSKIEEKIILKNLRKFYQISIYNNESIENFSLNFLHIIIYLYSKKKFLNLNSILIIIEDIFETIYLTNIEKHFEIFSTFIKNEKNNIENYELLLLYKVVNIINKRLSSSLDTNLKGKIQIFFSKIFDICDKSGVNIKGLYNNNEIYLSNMNNDNENNVNNNINNLNEIDYKFFKNFWIVQKILENPLNVRIINI
jgi:hypothetical protein